VHPAETPAPPPPAATAAPAPVVSAPPPHAKVAKPVKKSPAPAVVAAPIAPPPATAPAPEPVIPLAKIVRLPLSKRIAILHACGYDREAICSSVRPGGSRVLACLVAHAASLSPPCRREMEKALR
jgi:hypothetical protein